MNGSRKESDENGRLTRTQAREETTGYVGDATDDPDLEGGTFDLDHTRFGTES